MLKKLTFWLDFRKGQKMTKEYDLFSCIQMLQATTLLKFLQIEGALMIWSQGTHENVCDCFVVARML